MMLDGLDGRIARLTNTQTSFGEYFDSLSDMICFGLSPAILIYMWSASLFDLFSWQSNKMPWIICFIYIASVAIRLARFNSKSQIQDKKYFIADKILAKHDENYMPPQMKEILKENVK